MSPEERRVYMREYMRKRRANLKNVEVAPSIETDSYGVTEDDTSEGSSWLLWFILGGLALGMVGLIAFTVVSDIRASRAVKEDSEESKQSANPSINPPTIHTVPTPNLG